MDDKVVSPSSQLGAADTAVCSANTDTYYFAVLLEVSGKGPIKERRQDRLPWGRLASFICYIAYDVDNSSKNTVFRSSGSPVYTIYCSLKVDFNPIYTASIVSFERVCDWTRYPGSCARDRFLVPISDPAAAAAGQ